MQFNERTSKGLSTQQVNERIAQKKTNFVKKTINMLTKEKENDNL